MVIAYEPLYTVKEVSKVLKLNVNSVYELMDDGTLPYIKLGAKKVKGVDLEKFINSYETEAPRAVLKENDDESNDL